VFVAVLMVVVFVVAALQYKRHVHALIAITTSALVAPAVVAFMSFVYPADPKDQMWAMIAIPVSYVYALVASAIGCGVVALTRRSEKRDA
jgi:hypothetical protein